MRLLADECIPRKSFELLRRLRNPCEPPEVDMVHLLDLLGSGARDDEWVRLIAQGDPPFLVLTGDRGATSRRPDPRLPALLPQFKVTGVYLSGKLQQRTGFEKARALLVVWPQLEKAYTDPPGSRFRLNAHRAGYQLTPWPA
jgi:hypothetical protein